MAIRLSDHFTYRRLLRFTFPSIVMVLFTSIYGIVDGYFVSNFAGKVAFTAVNFVMPLILILSSIGFMAGSGGSALIGMYLGQSRKRLAHVVFTMLVVLTICVSVAIGIAGAVFVRPLVVMMGGRGEMLEQAVMYGRISFLGFPFFLLQMEFQSFFILAERPKLGLYTTLLAGVLNMVLDAWFVGWNHWGVQGAAVATILSQLVGAAIPLVYFSRPNGSLLRFTRFFVRLPILWKICINGSSEMVTNLSASFVGMLYNYQLLKYAGEDGVAAYGVLMYVTFVFFACFIGYSVGIAPVISFHYGAETPRELRSILRKSGWMLGITSIAMLVSSELLSRPASYLFAGYDSGFMALTCRAFRIFSIVFLFCGVPVFVSSFFTALNDGFTSAFISFMRTLALQVIAILVMPKIWGVDGIWWATVVAEFLSAVIACCFLWRNRSRYKY